MPSQAHEGKSDSLPIIIESFSPLPGLNPLDPSRAFPLSSFTSEGGRQLGPHIPDANQMSLNRSDLEKWAEDFNAGTTCTTVIGAMSGVKHSEPE